MVANFNMIKKKAAEVQNARRKMPKQLKRDNKYEVN